ncbi:hypothetical protein BaRGS_00008560, partial [Batillaria attramentaria]
IVATLKQFIVSLHQQAVDFGSQCGGSHDDVLVNICFVDEHFKHIKGNNKVLWKSLMSEDVETLTQLYQDNTGEDTSGLTSFTQTVGACMRLREWHGAHVSLVVPRDEHQDGSLQLLKSVLHADVQLDDQLQPMFHPQWRGVLTWMSLDNFTQPDVSVVCRDQRRLACKLQNLHHWKRKPGVKSQADSPRLVFGRRLETLACDALLVRLPLYERTMVPTAAAQGLSEAAWKEGITATGRPASDAEKAPLPCRQHLFLLIVGGSQDTGRYKVLVMRSPSEINGTLFEELHHLAYFGCHDNSDLKMEPGTRTSKDMMQLPEIRADTFLTVESVCLETVAEIIQHHNESKGQTAQLTTGELATCVREGQEILLSLAAEREQDKRHHESSCWSPPGQFLPVSDLECDPSEWPEREALVDTECKEKGLRRFQSGDSIGLASPLGLVDESSLDARDMSKWFKADGTAVLDKLSPVKLVSGPQRLSSWDEASLHYEHEYEKQEQYFKKFRDTIMLEEGHHSFSDNPHIPALKYRRSRRRSQLDVSCGGSKLTPITRHPSASSMMSAPRMVRKQRDRASDGRKEPLTATGRLVKTLPQGDKRLSAPLLARKDSIPRGSSEDGVPPAKRLRSHESFSSASRNSSVSVFHSVSTSSVNSLPPLRRLSQGPDIVNIFTPPSSKRGPNQVTPDSPAESVPQQMITSNTPLAPGASSQDDDLRRLSSESTSSVVSVGSGGASARESRSQRHKRKLEETVAGVLEAAGVMSSDLIYTSCLTKLYQVTKFFVKQLPNSRNLRAEMKEIAEKQVQQVVDLERRRQDLAVKKKLRTSSVVTGKSASQNGKGSLP